MAILTTNISSVSLAVSGNTTQSTNISWTCPSVPTGSTINSCTLTGTATASMSKGSPTIKVNGTTVSAGSSFTINLGTSNTTSSVTATTVGSNKNAKGTVTFSNLVYRVNYTEPVVTYTVTFKDWDGTVLKTENVGAGNSATAPSDPSRTGYTFTGWSVDFSNVTSNIITVAQYVAVHILRIKENNTWITNISKVYKKVEGIWVEQPNNEWPNIFNLNIRYQQKDNPIIPTAVLYEDGTLVFSNNDVVDDEYGTIIGVYTGWHINEYDGANNPWRGDNSSIKKVYAKNLIAPLYMSYWFHTCGSLTSLDFSNFNTKNVIRMEGMFNSCSSLASLDLSNFDTSNVTDMSGMFANCSKLTSLDLSNFNTSNVTDMSTMFNGCSSLTSLNLSSFDTSAVTSTFMMFYRCQGLVSLDLSSFDMSNVTSTDFMFNACTNLQTIYVKDETAKTKIESGINFPSTATVVIGSPNN